MRIIISAVNAVVDALNSDEGHIYHCCLSNQVLQGCHWVNEILDWILRLIQKALVHRDIGTVALAALVNVASSSQLHLRKSTSDLDQLADSL